MTMDFMDYLLLVVLGLVAALPYAYLIGRMVGIGYFAAKLRYHRQIMAEYAYDLDEDDNEREEDNGRTLSTQSP